MTTGLLLSKTVLMAQFNLWFDDVYVMSHYTHL